MDKIKMANDLSNVIRVFDGSHDKGAGEIAEHIIGEGYVPKSMALELVEACKNCGGTGDISVDYINTGYLMCEPCHGRGIVLREGGK